MLYKIFQQITALQFLSPKTLYHLSSILRQTTVREKGQNLVVEIYKQCEYEQQPNSVTIVPPQINEIAFEGISFCGYHMAVSENQAGDPEDSQGHLLVSARKNTICANFHSQKTHCIFRKEFEQSIHALGGQTSLPKFEPRNNEPLKTSLSLSLSSQAWLSHLTEDRRMHCLCTVVQGSNH